MHTVKTHTGWQAGAHMQPVCPSSSLFFLKRAANLQALTIYDHDTIMLPCTRDTDAHRPVGETYTFVIVVDQREGGPPPLGMVWQIGDSKGNSGQGLGSKLTKKSITWKGSVQCTW